MRGSKQSTGQEQGKGWWNITGCFTNHTFALSSQCIKKK